VEDKLTSLIEKVRKAWGDRLVSVILYGSAAMDDWEQNRSDLNILCVLDRLTPAELGASEPVFRWWREQGNPPPLLLTAAELRASTDCFPMEFFDMREHRRVLHGSDVIRELPVDHRFYRAQVEHELRSKQIRLRQRAAEFLGDGPRLQRLMADSLSTFCVLGRHALVLSGESPHWKKPEILRALEQRIGSPLPGANEILAVRTSGKTGSGQSAALTLERYLDDFEKLVRFVDGLEN
jgi:predicted nucleotidyltransferase